MERFYGGDKSKIPVIDCLGVKPAPIPSLPDAYVLWTGHEVKLTPPALLPAAEHWLQVLAGSELNWWHAIVYCTRHILYCQSLRRILIPRAGQKIVIHLLGDQPNQFSIYGAARSFGQRQPDFLTVDIRCVATSRLINLSLFEERQHDAVPLYLQFKYEPLHPYVPIHEIVEGRNKRFKASYWRLWFGDDEEPLDLDVRDTFTGPEVTISANDVEAFCLVVGNRQERFKTVRTDEVKVPIEYAIAAGW